MAQQAKKILNRGNELKDLLKTNGLAFSEAKNELSFESKKRQLERKISPIIDELWGGRAGFRRQVPGDGGSTRVQVSGSRFQKTEAQDAGYAGHEKGQIVNCSAPRWRRLAPVECPLVRMTVARVGRAVYRNDAMDTMSSASRKEEAIEFSKSERTIRECL
jgi:hypothetical protein